VGGEACPAPLRSTYKHNNGPRDGGRNAASHCALRARNPRSDELSLLLCILLVDSSARREGERTIINGLDTQRSACADRPYDFNVPFYANACNHYTRVTD